MKSESQLKTEYTDDEINDLSEWLENLTIRQIFFLRESYEAYLNAQAQSCSEANCVH